MGSPPPSPPVVTMSCPGPTIIGYPPTFTATTEQEVTFSFYFGTGTNPVSTGSGTNTTYTPGKKLCQVHTVFVL